MNLKRFHALFLLLKKKSDGTTLIEVLVAVAVISVIGFAVWIGFSTTILMIKKIPTVVDGTISLIQYDVSLRKQLNRVKVPFWVYEYKAEEDSRSVQFPYCDGIATKLLIFEYNNDYVVIKTDSSDDKNPIDPPEPEIKYGPFSEVSFELVKNDDDELTGLQITVVSEKNNLGEMTIFLRFSCSPFWRMK
jgi:hypothetical protein